jgi:hypothetical protein
MPLHDGEVNPSEGEFFQQFYCIELANIHTK